MPDQFKKLDDLNWLSVQKYGGVMRAFGTAVPSGQSGYARSCLFQKTSQPTGLYVNYGTADSCSFGPLEGLTTTGTAPTITVAGSPEPPTGPTEFDSNAYFYGVLNVTAGQPTPTSTIWLEIEDAEDAGTYTTIPGTTVVGSGNVGTVTSIDPSWGGRKVRVQGSATNSVGTGTDTYTSGKTQTVPTVTIALNTSAPNVGDTVTATGGRTGGFPSSFASVAVQKSLNGTDWTFAASTFSTGSSAEASYVVLEADRGYVFRGFVGCCNDLGCAEGSTATTTAVPTSSPTAPTITVLRDFGGVATDESIYVREGVEATWGLTVTAGDEPVTTSLAIQVEYTADVWTTVAGPQLSVGDQTLSYTPDGDDVGFKMRAVGTALNGVSPNAFVISTETPAVDGAEGGLDVAATITANAFDDSTPAEGQYILVTTTASGNAGEVVTLYYSAIELETGNGTGEYESMGAANYTIFPGLNEIQLGITVGADWEGLRIRVTATAYNGIDPADTDTITTSAIADGVGAPVAPTITSFTVSDETPTVGDSITFAYTSDGDTPTSATVTKYQWNNTTATWDAGTPFSSGSGYTVLATDCDEPIRFVLRVTNAVGTDTSDSNIVACSDASAPSFTVSVEGSPASVEVGETINVTVTGSVTQYHRVFNKATWDLRRSAADNFAYWFEAGTTWTHWIRGDNGGNTGTKLLADLDIEADYKPIPTRIETTPRMIATGDTLTIEVDWRYNESDPPTSMSYALYTLGPEGKPDSLVFTGQSGTAPSAGLYIAQVSATNSQGTRTYAGGIIRVLPSLTALPTADLTAPEPTAGTFSSTIEAEAEQGSSGDFGYGVKVRGRLIHPPRFMLHEQPFNIGIWAEHPQNTVTNYVRIDEGPWLELSSKYEGIIPGTYGYGQYCKIDPANLSDGNHVVEFKSVPEGAGVSRNWTGDYQLAEANVPRGGDGYYQYEFWTNAGGTISVDRLYVSAAVDPANDDKAAGTAASPYGSISGALRYGVATSGNIGGTIIYLDAGDHTLHGTPSATTSGGAKCDWRCADGAAPGDALTRRAIQIMPAPGVAFGAPKIVGAAPHPVVPSNSATPYRLDIDTVVLIGITEQSARSGSTWLGDFKCGLIVKTTGTNYGLIDRWIGSVYNEHPLADFAVDAIFATAASSSYSACLDVFNAPRGTDHQSVGCIVQHVPEDAYGGVAINNCHGSYIAFDHFVGLTEGALSDIHPDFHQCFNTAGTVDNEFVLKCTARYGIQGQGQFMDGDSTDFSDGLIANLYIDNQTEWIGNQVFSCFNGRQDTFDYLIRDCKFIGGGIVGLENFDGTGTVWRNVWENDAGTDYAFVYFDSNNPETVWNNYGFPYTGPTTNLVYEFPWAPAFQTAPTLTETELTPVTDTVSVSYTAVGWPRMDVNFQWYTRAEGGGGLSAPIGGATTDTLTYAEVTPGQEVSCVVTLGANIYGPAVAVQTEWIGVSYQEVSYSTNLDTVASRIVSGKCRMMILGDSITQITATDIGQVGRPIPHSMVRTWKPDQWLGGDVAPNSYESPGSWFTQRQAVSGVTHYLTTGQPNLPGDNNAIMDFDAATPVGFHPNWLFASDISGSAVAGSIYRCFVSPGGTYFSVSWRNRAGDHKLIAQNSTWKFTPYWYDLGDDTTDNYNAVADLDLLLTQGNAAFGWTSTSYSTTTSAPGTGEWVMNYGTATGTLSTAPADPDASGLTAGFQGFGINLRAPSNAAWSTTIDGGNTGARFLLGGCAFERTDTTDGKGLWIGSIANGGWRYTNHRYEPADDYEPDEFGTGIPKNYTDEALLAYMQLHKIDTVMIYLGVNDSAMTSGDEDPAQYAANAQAVIDRLEAAHATAQGIDSSIQDLRIILVPPVDSQPSSDGRANMANYPAALLDLVDTHISLIDLYTKWSDEFGAYSTWQGTYLYDGVHPTPAGCDEWTTRIWNEILYSAGEVTVPSVTSVTFGGVVTENGPYTVTCTAVGDNKTYSFQRQRDDAGDNNFVNDGSAIDNGSNNVLSVTEADAAWTGDQIRYVVTVSNDGDTVTGTSSATTVQAQTVYATTDYLAIGASYDTNYDYPTFGETPTGADGSIGYSPDYWIQGVELRDATAGTGGTGANDELTIRCYSPTASQDWETNLPYIRVSEDGGSALAVGTLDRRFGVYLHFAAESDAQIAALQSINVIVELSPTPFASLL